MDLGLDLFSRLNFGQQVGNMHPVIYGHGGLPDAQIDNIERSLGFRLPPDFRYLLANMQDKGGVFFPWAQFDLQRYRKQIKWVLTGIEWSLERDFGWLERWGEKPKIFSDALELVRADFKSWPKIRHWCSLSSHTISAVAKT